MNQFTIKMLEGYQLRKAAASLSNTPQASKLAYAKYQQPDMSEVQQVAQQAAPNASDIPDEILEGVYRNTFELAKFGDKSEHAERLGSQVPADSGVESARQALEEFHQLAEQNGVDGKALTAALNQHVHDTYGGSGAQQGGQQAGGQDPQQGGQQQPQGGQGPKTPGSDATPGGTPQPQQGSLFSAGQMQATGKPVGDALKEGRGGSGAGGNIQTGPRGGRYMETSGGGKHYVGKSSTVAAIDILKGGAGGAPGTQGALDILKAGKHKYTRREGSPGHYRYFYGDEGKDKGKRAQPKAPPSEAETQAAEDAGFRNAGEKRVYDVLAASDGAPLLNQITRKTGLSEREVQVHLDRLSQDGDVESVMGADEFAQDGYRIAKGAGGSFSSGVSQGQGIGAGTASPGGTMPGTVGAAQSATSQAIDTLTEGRKKDPAGQQKAFDTECKACKAGNCSEHTIGKALTSRTLAIPFHLRQPHYDPSAVARSATAQTSRMYSSVAPPVEETLAEAAQVHGAMRGGETFKSCNAHGTTYRGQACPMCLTSKSMNRIDPRQPLGTR